MVGWKHANDPREDAIVRAAGIPGRGKIVLAVVTALLAWVDAAFALPECTASSQRPRVRMETTLGDIELLLCSADVPTAVDNFLQYVNDGAYTTTGFVHRSVQDGIFIVQGGGFHVVDQSFIGSVATRDPIALELVGLENLRGTIAMARTSALDSATSQWFINTQDNPQFDSGYAVFGEVTQGMDIVDLIAAQGIWALNSGILAEVPLVAYPDDGSSYLPYLVSVTNVVNLPEPGAWTQAMAVLLTLAAYARHRRPRRG